MLASAEGLASFHARFELDVDTADVIGEPLVNERHEPLGLSGVESTLCMSSSKPVKHLDELKVRLFIRLCRRVTVQATCTLARDSVPSRA